MEEIIENNRCRVFIQDVENKSWQLFSLEQSRRDGSIYLGSPEFKSFEWLTLGITDGQIRAFKVEQNKEGHISFHGDGKVHVKSENDKYKLTIDGQHLLKPDEKDISLRHLFTIFPKKPEYIPDSEALNRKSDQIIKSNETLRPFAAIAFALPRVGLKLDFMMSLSVEDLENMPGVLGVLTFSLIHHDIFIVFYRTKFMDIWPSKTMMHYVNGITVPVFIGEPWRNIRVELRQPVFEHKDKNLSIKL